MTAQLVTSSFPAGTSPNVVASQFAIAVMHSVEQQRGLDTTKNLYTVSPAITQTINVARQASRAVSQAAVAQAGGGPITVSALVDGATGAVTPSGAVSKQPIAYGPEVLDPNFHAYAPVIMKNPPGAPPLKTDPVTGEAHDLVAVYGTSTPNVAFGGAGLVANLKKVGGTAAGAIVGAMAGGPIGLMVGLAGGGLIDIVRARAKKA